MIADPWRSIYHNLGHRENEVRRSSEAVWCVPPPCPSILGAAKGEGMGWKGVMLYAPCTGRAMQGEGLEKDI